MSFLKWSLLGQRATSSSRGPTFTVLESSNSDRTNKEQCPSSLTGISLLFVLTVEVCDTRCLVQNPLYYPKTFLTSRP